MIDRDFIRYSLSLMDIRPGDTLLVHSALSAIGQVEGGADAVIDALLDAIGSEGTLVMSTLTGWGVPFDLDRTPSAVGLVSERFRLRPGVLRSRHPVHSVAALGRHAAEVVHGHEDCATGCGAGTPYDALIRLGGKVLLLGVDLDRNTLMHTLEEFADAFYLLRLDIPAPTWLGGADGARFTLRKFPPGHRDFLSLTPRLRAVGALIEGRIGNAVVKVLDLPKFVTVGLAALAADPEAFLCRNPHCPFCRWARLVRAGGPVDLEGFRGRGCLDPTCEICRVEENVVDGRV